MRRLLSEIINFSILEVLSSFVKLLHFLKGERGILRIEPNSSIRIHFPQLFVRKGGIGYSAFKV